jgi:hypothetical protein
VPRAPWRSKLRLTRAPPPAMRTLQGWCDTEVAFARARTCSSTSDRPTIPRWTSAAWGIHDGSPDMESTAFKLNGSRDAPLSCQRRATRQPSSYQWSPSLNRVCNTNLGSASHAFAVLGKPRRMAAYTEMPRARLPEKSHTVRKPATSHQIMASGVVTPGAGSIFLDSGTLIR